MALLSVEKRKAIFQYLGLGEYNEKNIKAFQKKYMLRKSDWDGVYGQNTDNTLRTVYFTKVYCKNFKPEEFRCECGGKYCCGYPSFMKPAMLQHIQSIRDHYDEPVTVTCGLRCKTYNSELGGSIQNSLHMQGLAVDFFQSGVTDPLSKRKSSIKYIKKMPNHHYTYGNGINSYGNSVSAPYMGNALHTDVYDNVTPTYPKYKEPEKPEDETPKEKTYKVIDVSDWQSQIDWKKVKAAEVVGAIIRYADGTTLDKRFDENMKNAKAAGLHVGSYIFSRAKTKAEAEKEATRLYKACKPYEPDMPLYIDLEVSSLSKYANTVAQAFLNKMKSLGGRGGVYANLNWWNNYLVDTFKNYSANPFWIAQYNDKMTHSDPKAFGMWQYSSSGKISGISGKVDMNKCYVAYWESVPKEDKPTEEQPKKEATVQQKIVAWAKKIAKDDSYIYVHWAKNDAKTKQCPICHKFPKGKYHGFYCTRFPISAWHHGGGIEIKCDKAPNNGQIEKIYNAKTDAEALKLARQYFGIKDIKVLRNKKGIPQEQLQAGDSCYYFRGSTCQHAFLYIGDGKMIDANSYKDKAKQIAVRKAMSCKVAVRYVGK